MIHWLLQTTSAHPDLAKGIAPAGLLSAAEADRLANMTFEKRRQDWLLGRWTAKHLLQVYCEMTFGHRPPLEALIVGRVPDGGGAPIAVLDPHFLLSNLPSETIISIIPLVGVAGKRSQEKIPTVAGLHLPLSLSISHSGQCAFCAVTGRDPGNVYIGADIERIKPRSQRFVQDYFTAEEIDLVSNAPASRQDMLVTAIWSAKEAVLKAMRLGLTVDTRRLSCLCVYPPQQRAWTTVNIRYDPFLLEQLAAEFSPPQRGAAEARKQLAAGRPGLSSGQMNGCDHALTGWWRAEDDCVLTLAVLTNLDRSQG